MVKIPSLLKINVLHHTTAGKHLNLEVTPFPGTLVPSAPPPTAQHTTGALQTNGLDSQQTQFPDTFKAWSPGGIAEYTIDENTTCGTQLSYKYLKLNQSQTLFKVNVLRLSTGKESEKEP